MGEVVANTGLRLGTQKASKMTAVTLAYVQTRHSNWIKSMGWREKDPCTDQSDTECLGILVAEIGEAIDVCRRERQLAPEFGTALADIVLAAVEFADRNQIALAEWVSPDGPPGINDIGQNHIEGSDTHPTPIESLTHIIPEVAKAMQGCGKTGRWADIRLRPSLASVVTRTIILAARQGVDLEACLLAKMEANEATGVKND